MTKQVKEHSERDRLIAGEASRWHESLPRATNEKRDEFTRWLTQSPTHVREFLLSDFIDDALLRFDPNRKISLKISSDNANVVPLPSRAASDAKVDATALRRRRRPHWLVATTIAAGLVVCVVSLLYLNQRAHIETYETSIGEQRTVSLADGSVVAMNANTRLAVELEPNERNLRLDQGQAIFTVAHDSKRPFRVSVGGVAIRAVGTKFDVRRVGGQATVSVMEGRVQIEQQRPARSLSIPDADIPPPQLSSGQGITILQGGELMPPSLVDLATVTAWQDRRLIFEERTLAQIAQDFAEYSRSPILTVEGEALRARLYTGTFDADRPDSFVEYLERDPSIEIVRSEHQIVIRMAAG